MARMSRTRRRARSLTDHGAPARPVRRNALRAADSEQYEGGGYGEHGRGHRAARPAGVHPPHAGESLMAALTAVAQLDRDHVACRDALRDVRGDRRAAA